MSRWIGQGATIEEPYNVLVPQLGPARHEAFIHTTAQQYVTTIAPPLWVWADNRRLAGAWRFLATTYVDYWDGYVPHDQQVNTSLVPLNTIKSDNFITVR